MLTLVFQIENLNGQRFSSMRLFIIPLLFVCSIKFILL